MKVKIASDDMTFTQVTRKTIIASKIAIGHTQTMPFFHSRRRQAEKYRVSQEECAILREGVPYVKIYRYNPKHQCPKLNGYGDNGQRSLKL
jgi:hypothetical protein